MVKYLNYIERHGRLKKYFFLGEKKLTGDWKLSLLFILGTNNDLGYNVGI